MNRTIFGAHTAVDAPNTLDDKASGRLAHVLGPTLSNPSALVPLSSCRNYGEAIETARSFEANRLARLEKDAKEERETNARSEAYHAHPSHPSTCPAYENNTGHRMRCPCESYNGE